MSTVLFRRMLFMKKIYRIISLVLACALALSCAVQLSACDGQDDVTDDCDVSFSDALGRPVRICGCPERTAALVGSLADVWVLAGGELCAAPRDAWEDFGLELDAVDLGGAHSPSLELLISSSPDFVIASASTASNVEMMTVLEDMGITVAYFDVDNFSDYLEMLNICTRITGRADLYEKNGTALSAAIEAVKARYAEEDIPEEQRRILLLRASSTSVKAKGSRGTVLGEMLSDIGCINIADTDSGLLENLSVEAVIREEPYHVFVVTMGDDEERSFRTLENMMEENPAWGTLRAVREGRMHVMDKALFNLKPNDRWALAYGLLYEKLTEK